MHLPTFLDVTRLLSSLTHSSNELCVCVKPVAEYISTQCPPQKKICIYTCCDFFFFIDDRPLSTTSSTLSTKANVCDGTEVPLEPSYVKSAYKVCVCVNVMVNVRELMSVISITLYVKAFLVSFSQAL